MPDPDVQRCRGGQGNSAESVADKAWLLPVLFAVCVVGFFVGRWWLDG